MKLIKSKQPGLKVKQNVPAFQYLFETEPVEVQDEHWEIINKKLPGEFEVVSKTSKSTAKTPQGVE